MTVDITIPVLNEDWTLERQIRILHFFLSENFIDNNKWNIIIADNGSTDYTEKIGQSLAAQIDEVQYIRLEKRGVGLALKTSWEQSQADIVGYMDLDLATDLKHFLEAYNAINNENYDIVYGTRLHTQSKVIGRTLKREISSRIFNLLLKNYLRTNFSDGMCGFKWLKREKYPLLYDSGAQNDGWFFSTELLTTAEWNKLSIKELPVIWTDDAASSKVKVLPLAKKYIKAMQELKKHRK